MDCLDGGSISAGAGFCEGSNDFLEVGFLVWQTGKEVRLEVKEKEDRFLHLAV